MSRGPAATRGAQTPEWVSLLRIAVIVALAFALTEPIEDGPARFAVMLAFAVVAGLLIRFSGSGWRAWQARRRRGG